MNILYEPLPDTVSADGREYRVITDFQEWIRFADMIGDSSLTAEEKVRFAVQWLLDKPEYMTEELMLALLSFYRAEALDPEKPEDDECEEDCEMQNKPPVFSWKYDAKYIVGDFLHYYGIDLFNESLHWWHFRCLMAALPDDSACQKRIAYRSADLSRIKDDAERHRIMRIQRQIAIPYEMTDDDISAVFEV